MYVSFPQAAPQAQPSGMCAACNRWVPTRPSSFVLVIGLVLVAAFPRSTGAFCRACSSKMFWLKTPLTLVLGWWSVFAVLLMPLAVGFNLHGYLESRWLGERNDLPPAVPEAPPVVLAGAALAFMGLAPTAAALFTIWPAVMTILQDKELGENGNGYVLLAVLFGTVAVTFFGAAAVCIYHAQRYAKARRVPVPVPGVYR